MQALARGSSQEVIKKVRIPQVKIDLVMSLARTISTQLLLRLRLIAMLVVSGVVALLGSQVQAGVILPWIDESAPVLADFAYDGLGSSSSQAELPVASEPIPCKGDNCQESEVLIAGLLEAGGGASAPVNSASGQTSTLVAAMFQLPVVAQSLACSSRHLRERSLQLPHPPLGELLDPPKTGV